MVSSYEINTLWIKAALLTLPLKEKMVLSSLFMIWVVLKKDFIYNYKALNFQEKTQRLNLDTAEICFFLNVSSHILYIFEWCHSNCLNADALPVKRVSHNTSKFMSIRVFLSCFVRYNYLINNLPLCKKSPSLMILDSIYIQAA